MAPAKYPTRRPSAATVPASLYHVRCSIRRTPSTPSIVVSILISVLSLSSRQKAVISDER